MKTTPQNRLASLDCLRGLFLVVILFEHVRQMVSGVIFRETASVPGLQAMGDFGGCIRAASHPCAPGFFWLLGMGMVLWEARHPGTISSRWRHFLKRGVLLVVAQVCLENLGWAIPLVLHGGLAQVDGSPLYLGVLFTLGVATVIGCAMLRMPGRFLLPVALLFVVSPPWAATLSLPSSVSWLFIDTATARFDIPFPVLPWTGMSLLGILYARKRFAPLTGLGGNVVVKPLPSKLALLLLGFCLAAATAAAVVFPAAFFKYPPSLLFSLGMLAIVVALFEAFSAVRFLDWNALRLLGRNSLVAYLLPLYLAGLATWGDRRHSFLAFAVTAVAVFATTSAVCLVREKGRDNFSFFAPGYDAFMRLFGLYRTDELRQEFAGIAPGMSLLDVAGGTGFIAQRLSDLFARVVVSDLSPDMLAVAQKRKLTTVCASASQLPFGPAEFDVVLCVDALHHIRDREAALDEMARVLKPGGTLLIQEFHIRGLRGFLFFAFERLLIDQSRFLAPESLLDALSRRNFNGRIRKLSGLGYLYTGIKT